MALKNIGLFLLVLLLAGCSMQKRKYQKGYALHWKTTKTANKSKATATAKNTVDSQHQNSKTPEQEIEPTQNEVQAYASANTSPEEIAVKKPATLRLDDPCDELVLRDGTEQKAKILEISDTEIKYKKCDMPDGPVYVAKKRNVFMIRYANGTKEVFGETPSSKEQQTKKNDDNYTGPKTYHPLAILSFIFGILSFFPFPPVALSILAITFGRLALTRIAAEPNRYKGRQMAKAARVLGIISLSLYILFSIILISFLLFALVFFI